MSFLGERDIELQSMLLEEDNTVQAKIKIGGEIITTRYTPFMFQIGPVAYMFLWETEASPSMNKIRWDYYRKLRSEGILIDQYSHYDEIAKKY